MLEIELRHSFSEFINGDKSTTTMASLTSSDLEGITTEYQGNFSNLMNTGLLTALPSYVIVFLIYIFSSRVQNNKWSRSAQVMCFSLSIQRNYIS